MSTATGSAGHLDIGGVFEATTDLWKKTFGTVWIVALILMIPAEIIVSLLGDDGVLGVIAYLVHAFASLWLAGTVVRIVQDAEADGRVDASVGDLFGSVAPKLITLFLLSIVLSVLIGIGFILLIIPGVILTLMWLVSVPAMVVEDKGVFDSMSRSADLTKDNRMRILGVGILLFAAVIVVGLAAILLAAITPILGIIAGIALAVIVYPWLSIVVAVLYFRLREVKGERTVVDTGVDGGIEPPAPAV